MKSTTKRRRSTKAEQATLDDQILAVLREDHPQSVRHVYYRMTDPRLEVVIPKTEHGYQRVQRRCLALRRSGRLAYGWISDSTRTGFHVDTYVDAGDFVEAMAGLYRGRLWTPDLPHVEVWVESRSLAGVLRDTCRQLAVSLYPCGGFTSATLAYEAADYVRAIRPERVVVVYVGDFDPAGVLIDQSLESELRRHLGAIPLEFRRLAVNPDQIAKWNLPAKPRKAGDRRRPDVRETVEAEAVPAATMRALVREAVESYLPAGALDAVRVAEASEREGLRKLGAHLTEYGLPDFTRPAA